MSELIAHVPEGFILVDVLYNELKTEKEDDSFYWTIGLSIKDTDLQYKTLSKCLVFPPNDEEEVRKFLRGLGRDGSTMVKLGNYLSTSTYFKKCILEYVSLLELLVYYVDIFSFPSFELMRCVGDMARVSEELDIASSIQNTIDANDVFVAFNRTIADFLYEYRQVMIDWEELLPYLPLKGPEKFTISSSGLVHGSSQVELLYETRPDFFTKKYFSSTANKLSKFVPGEEKLSIMIVQPEFQQHPREDLMMVCTGLGLAAILAVIEDRVYTRQSGQSVGKLTALYSTTTTVHSEFLNRIAKARSDGVLGNFFLHSENPHGSDAIPLPLFLQKEAVAVWNLLGGGETSKFYYAGPKGDLPTAIEQAIRVSSPFGSVVADELIAEKKTQRQWFVADESKKIEQVQNCGGQLSSMGNVTSVYNNAGRLIAGSLEKVLYWALLNDAEERAKVLSLSYRVYCTNVELARKLRRVYDENRENAALLNNVVVFLKEWCRSWLQDDILTLPDQGLDVMKLATQIDPSAGAHLQLALLKAKAADVARSTSSPVQQSKVSVSAEGAIQSQQGKTSSEKSISEVAAQLIGNSNFPQERGLGPPLSTTVSNPTIVRYSSSDCTFNKPPKKRIILFRPPSDTEQQDMTKVTERRRILSEEEAGYSSLASPVGHAKLLSEINFNSSDLSSTRRGGHRDAQTNEESLISRISQTNAPREKKKKGGLAGLISGNKGSPIMSLRSERRENGSGEAVSSESGGKETGCSQLDDLQVIQLPRTFSGGTSQDDEPCLCLGYRPDMMAMALNSLASKIYSDMSPLELLGCKWMKARADRLAPNVIALSQHYNKVTSWVSRAILMASSKKRKKMVKYFVRVGLHLLTMGDFLTMGGVYGGLSHFAVMRLKKLQSELGKEAKSGHAKMAEACDPLSNNSNYRAAWKSYQGDTGVPYLAIHLRDIVFAEDANENYYKNKKLNLVNVQKLLLIHRIIGEVFRHRKRAGTHIDWSKTSSPKKNKSMMGILEYLDSYLHTESDDVLYELSKIIQPMASASAASLTESTDDNSDLPPSNTMLANNMILREFFRQCQRDDVQSVRLMLSDNVVKCDSRDQEAGDTPLHVAAYHGSLKTMKLIVTALTQSQKHLDIRNHQGDTSLHIACRMMSVKCVEYLLSKGCDPLSMNNEGERPLQKSNSQVREFLLSNILLPTLASFIQVAVAHYRRGNYQPQRDNDEDDSSSPLPPLPDPRTPSPPPTSSRTPPSHLTPTSSSQNISLNNSSESNEMISMDNNDLSSSPSSLTPSASVPSSTPSSNTSSYISSDGDTTERNRKQSRPQWHGYRLPLLFEQRSHARQSTFSRNTIKLRKPRATRSGSVQINETNSPWHEGGSQTHRDSVDSRSNINTMLDNDKSALQHYWPRLEEHQRRALTISPSTLCDLHISATVKTDGGGSGQEKKKEVVVGWLEKASRKSLLANKDVAELSLITEYHMFVCLAGAHVISYLQGAYQEGVGGEVRGERERPMSPTVRLFTLPTKITASNSYYSLAEREREESAWTEVSDVEGLYSDGHEEEDQNKAVRAGRTPPKERKKKRAIKAHSVHHHSGSSKPAPSLPSTPPHKTCPVRNTLSSTPPLPSSSSTSSSSSSSPGAASISQIALPTMDQYIVQATHWLHLLFLAVQQMFYEEETLFADFNYSTSFQHTLSHYNYLTKFDECLKTAVSILPQSFQAPPQIKKAGVGKSSNPDSKDQGGNDQLKNETKKKNNQVRKRKLTSLQFEMMELMASLEAHMEIEDEGLFLQCRAKSGGGKKKKNGNRE